MRPHTELWTRKSLALLIVLSLAGLASLPRAEAGGSNACLQGEICAPVCGDGVCDVDEMCPEDCDPAPFVPPDPPEPPHNTVEHTAAAAQALSQSCAKSLGITPLEAAQWMNGADCYGNSCAGDTDLLADAGSTQGQNAKWNMTCWACRNPDHFTSNPFTDWKGRSSLDPNGFSGDWTPKDSVQAQTDLINRALSLAQSVANDDDRKAALKVAFQACHYATDQTACGHVIGNVFCDPTGGTVTDACRQFVNQNRGIARTTSDQIAIDMTPTVCSGGSISAAMSYAYGTGWQARSCDALLRAFNWQPSEGLALAAQERFIRHHSAGFPLTDGRSNTCAGSCTSGECLPDHETEPENVRSGADTTAVAAACRALLNQVCDRMPSRPKVAHKKCERDQFGIAHVVIGECRDAVPLPDSPSYGEQTYPTCYEALTHAQLERDPPGCFGFVPVAGGAGGPIGFTNASYTTCDACRTTGQECGFALCPGGGIQYCGGCGGGLTCSGGICGVGTGSTKLVCTDITCGWDNSDGQPTCCDTACPGSCPTYGYPPAGGGAGSQDACDKAGYWSDGGCWDSSICEGRSVFLKDGTECFQ